MHIFLRKGSLTTPAEILNRRLEERKQLQLVGLPGQKITIHPGSGRWNLNMFLGGLFFKRQPSGRVYAIMVINHCDVKVLYVCWVGCFLLHQHLWVISALTATPEKRPS